MASAEDQGKTRAKVEAADARRERDDALKQVANIKVQCKEWTRTPIGPHVLNVTFLVFFKAFPLYLTIL